MIVKNLMRKFSGRGRWLAALLLPAAAIVATGCGSEATPPASTAATTVRVNTPADIAQESAADYNNNVNGIITGQTLKSWMSNWVANRPAGITGKLIILQASVGEATAEHFKPDNKTVFTYVSPSTEWVQTRSNGVIVTQSMVPDGPSMDALLKKYNIDPQNDMIVVAMGTASTGNAMAQGRIWYALRYWGVEAKNLALLNGGNLWQITNGSMVAGDFQADFDTATAGNQSPSAPNTGVASVKDLKVDNTALQATLQDMLSVLPSSDANVLNDRVFIWDARNLGQYSARDKIENGEDTDAVTAGTQACASAYCDPVESPVNIMSTFQNSGSRQGHPWGALQLQYTRLLDATQGYSYKPKAALASYLNGEVDGSGVGFVDATYSPVGATRAYQAGDTVYTYCETTFRAMITGIASGVILGKPTRFYDGAMVEWNSLSYLQDWLGNYILPSGSPWRTDVKSFYKAATSSTLVAPRTITDASAANANKIVTEDKAYKAPASSSTGGASSPGGSLPPNPCGG